MLAQKKRGFFLIICYCSIISACTPDGHFQDLRQLPEQDSIQKPNPQTLAQTKQELLQHRAESQALDTASNA